MSFKVFVINHPSADLSRKKHLNERIRVTKHLWERKDETKDLEYAFPSLFAGLTFNNFMNVNSRYPKTWIVKTVWGKQNYK